jgi:lipoic acid synthetase
MKQPILEKPHWLRKRLPLGRSSLKIEEALQQHGLHTICQEGCCPNQGECFSRGVATFLILGKVCTRNCRFCAVSSGTPQPADPDEPTKIAHEVKEMGVGFAVVTSVTRDDLPDGGADHFAQVIHAIRKRCPNVGIEVLIPDFKGSSSALRAVLDALPEVLNHNVETAPRLYPNVRPQADYGRSIRLLGKVKEIRNSMVTKSGLMLGLGETGKEVRQVMQDLRNVHCDILTIGQYLCPSENHHPVVEYISPEVFREYENTALEMGFSGVASSPFVRSSYMADTFYRKAIEKSQASSPPPAN